MRWIAATLLGLLALAWALLTFAAPSTEVVPAPNDTGLGGLSILAQTLQKAGYRVAFDRSSRPRLSLDDVVVAPTLGDRPIPKAALAHARKGGRAWILSVPKALQPVGEPVVAYDVLGREAQIDVTESVNPNPERPEGLLGSVVSWRTDESNVASKAMLGQGSIVRLGQGALATNRFLSRAGNAKVVLSTLGTLAKPGDRLVFIADGYGGAEDLGPIEAIGPWAVGALWQGLALLAAFGLARGVRFGLAAPEREAKRGARELLDAVASYYQRGKRTEAALAAAARERPDDPAIQSLAAGKKVPEVEARRAMVELESRPRARR